MILILKIALFLCLINNLGDTHETPCYETLCIETPVFQNGQQNQPAQHSLKSNARRHTPIA